jgi:catechol 2,3-dioxygenase-like lactoylglutathione lyase family enzyme
MMKPPIPVLRSFSEEKAKAFYLDFLGFELAWEHRFAQGMPLYMEVVSGDCVLHLSEHHGDGVPGLHIRVEVDGLEGFVAQLRQVDYPNCSPGETKEQPWGRREVELVDPFGNRITFCEKTNH